LAMGGTARILVNLYDGLRQPVSAVHWIARISDGRPLADRDTQTVDLDTSSHLFDVTFFDNLFDNYTVVASPDGHVDTGWAPVRANPRAPAVLDLMTFPRNGQAHFARATWEKLQAVRPIVAQSVLCGCENAAAAREKYLCVVERRPEALACFLNIMTALADVRLPSGKKPLDYYWNVCWPTGDCNDLTWPVRLDTVFKQDRFFCYVAEEILPDVREAARYGSFAEEKDPSIWGHGDATESYKQTQFDIANIQLTFHGRDECILPGLDGTPTKCVKIEPDIDYYKDLMAHAFLEVIPNTATHGLTDPKVAYVLRWMAGRRAGMPEFDPLYTVEA